MLLVTWPLMPRLPPPSPPDPALDPAQAFALARKDALARLPDGGSKSPYADLVAHLGTLAAPTLLPPAHVAALLRAVRAGGARRGDGKGATADAAARHKAVDVEVGVR